MSDDFDFEDGFRQANEHSGKGLHQEAAEIYQRCLREQPNHEWALNNFGFSLNQLGRFPEAIGCLQHVVVLHPNNLTAHANLAAAWDGSGQKHEALNCRRRLTELKPDSSDFHADLANLLLSMGRANEALTSYERSLALSTQDRSVIHNYLLTTNYADTLSAEEVAETHFKWAATKPVQRRSAHEFENSPQSDRRLRIGYVSTDFSTHPVGKLMVGILAATKSAVDNYCYSDSKVSDAWTARIRTETVSFQETSQLNDSDFCSMAVRDRIDVLVDLNGHSGGRNRLSAFAMGAAPVQTSFLGYPNTTGHPAVDYYISDALCTPIGMSDHLFSESLWRLPTGCLAFRSPEDMPLPEKKPFETNGYFTFGSFNNPSKVSPTTLAAWAEILNAVPDSRLQVRYAKAFGSSVLRERWLDRLCGANVDPQRIRFITTPLPYREHLATFANVDLCLDPFPYQGTMTTLEALSAGSPVLTKAGRNYCHRASSSLLLRLGEHQLVTGSVDEYIEAATHFGRHPDRLLPIRNRIATNFRSSSICDVELLGRELADAYKGMWQKWCLSRSTSKDFDASPVIPDRTVAARNIFVTGVDPLLSENLAQLLCLILAGHNSMVRQKLLFTVEGIPLQQQSFVRPDDASYVFFVRRPTADDVHQSGNDDTTWLFVSASPPSAETDPVAVAVERSSKNLLIQPEQLQQKKNGLVKALAHWLEVDLSVDQLSQISQSPEASCCTDHQETEGAFA